MQISGIVEWISNNRQLLTTGEESLQIREGNSCGHSAPRVNGDVQTIIIVLFQVVTSFVTYPFSHSCSVVVS